MMKMCFGMAVLLFVMSGCNSESGSRSDYSSNQYPPAKSPKEALNLLIDRMCAGDLQSVDKYATGDLLKSIREIYTPDAKGIEALKKSGMRLKMKQFVWGTETEHEATATSIKDTTYRFERLDSGWKLSTIERE